ncbi:MAG TPA: class I SAM-dependent methyltransferase [Solirubrobacteraceae bacterium]|jgi:ubiquinone/menaquinone biosynthesis C-methylase UbiE|nr:class I SAM-dependent methyltransferase [Solirubrobacteraceae bacterium]
MTDQATMVKIKNAQQQMWSTGDFAELATGLVIVGELLCEAVDVLPGERVLDVACGSGTATLAAARRFAEVTGVDYVPELLERGRGRAAAERLDIAWVQGDAEALPFDDGSFDVVLTTFGSMFAPDHAQAAHELLRVCRPGGRIGMANWTPDGVMGQLFATITKHAPPPAELDPPGLWGVEQYLQKLLVGVASLHATPIDFVLRFRSVEHWLAVFHENFGPLKTAHTRLDAAGQQALSQELTELMTRHNRAGDAALVVPLRYLQVVAQRSKKIA